jgi:hypothetical protein
LLRETIRTQQYKKELFCVKTYDHHLVQELVAVPAKHNTKVITVSVEEKYDAHETKIPKCNKFNTFFYVTPIKTFSNRLPEGKGSVAFKQMVIIVSITSVQSNFVHYVLQRQRGGEDVYLHSFSSSALWRCVVSVHSTRFAHGKEPRCPLE